MGQVRRANAVAALRALRGTGRIVAFGFVGCGSREGMLRAARTRWVRAIDDDGEDPVAQTAAPLDARPVSQHAQTRLFRRILSGHAGSIGE